jgi:hypothetical protein
MAVSPSPFWRTSCGVKRRSWWKVRRLTLLGSGQELTEQFVELDLPDSHPPVGVGKQIEVRVRKVLSVFMGNARIMGDIIESKKM